MLVGSVSARAPQGERAGGRLKALQYVVVDDDLVCGDSRAPGAVHLLEMLVDRVETQLASPVMRVPNFIRQVRVDDRLCSLRKPSLTLYR